MHDSEFFIAIGVFIPSYKLPEYTIRFFYIESIPVHRQFPEHPAGCLFFALIPVKEWLYCKVAECGTFLAPNKWRHPKVFVIDTF
jgi:hypothetical protein